MSCCTSRNIFYKKQGKKSTSNVSKFSQKLALVLFLICFLVFQFTSSFSSFFTLLLSKELGFIVENLWFLWKLCLINGTMGCKNMIFEFAFDKFVSYFFKATSLCFLFEPKFNYSRLPNKRNPWNNSTPWTFFQN